MFKLTLSIRKGVMYLVVEEVIAFDKENNATGIFYEDFSHMMEGFTFKDIKNEYVPELSKKFKSIAFVKQS